MPSVTDLLTACKVTVEPGDVVVDLPNGEVVYYRDPSHRYFRLTENGKEPLTAVTSVLSVLDKPGLLSWVRKVTLEGKNYWEARDEASTRGTSVHTALELLARDGTVPMLADFPEDDRGYIQALAAWWVDAAPKVIATEVIVASVEHRFAGRFDLLAEINGRRTLVDLKTSKRIFPVENFSQLAAYELASVESGYPETECQMIVRVGENGKFEVAESCASAADFLGIKAAFDAQKRIEKEHKLLLKAAA